MLRKDLMTQEKKLNTETEFYKGLQKIAEGTYLFVQEIGKALIPVAQAIQDILKNIDQEKLKIFLENIKKIQQNEPYLKKLIEDIKTNKNLSHVDEVITFSCLIKLIFENEDSPENLHIYDVIRTKYFNEMFFSLFDSLELGENFKKRRNIIEEAFKLYELQFYAGCLTLLYGQLEGILTDYLVFNGLLEKNKNYYNYLGDAIPNTDIDKKKKITGIFDKILIAKNMNIYFGKLDAYKLDSKYKINNDRNDVLHGNILDRFSQERCFILIIWLTSIFNFLLSEQQIQKSLSTK